MQQGTSDQQHCRDEKQQRERLFEPARRGPLPELGFFFKDPLGDGPSALAEQWAVLAAFTHGLG